MTIEEIRKNAPQGATHYNFNKENYFKKIDDEWHVYWIHKKYWVQVSEWVVNEIIDQIKPL